MAQGFEGKTALVTGAARGLGRAIAEMLAERGCAVAVLDLKAAWAQAVADAIGARGGRAMAIGADVSDREAMHKAIADTVAWGGGRLDVLVGNAMWIHYEPLAELRPETLQRSVGVGFAGIVWGMQAAAPVMKAQGGGSIVNIASVAAVLGLRNSVVYSGIKAGVAGLTRAAAAELAPDRVRVNAVAPSTVPTEGVTAMLSEERLQARVAQTPLGRLATPDDIARAVCFLAGEESGFVTGQMLVVDGGLSTSA